jgi:hypothetical protein
MKIRILTLGLALGVSTILSGCSTTQAQFEKNPQGISKGAICRAFLESGDPYFRKNLEMELVRRNVNPYDCPAMVLAQNQAAAAIVAVALVGTAVAVCANNDCGGGSSYRGNCQYDWEYDAAGNRCGRRSAYARPGGY